MISIRVLFLGPAGDFAGVASVSLEVDAATTVADVRRLLSERYPRLGKALGTMRVAVNEEFARDDRVLKSNDEVALIPPVSGGSEGDHIWVELVRADIPAGRVREFVLNDSALGGVCTFEGVTRAERDANHGPLVHLEYEAYESMAAKQLRCLADQATECWSVGRLAILHRLGCVPVGQVSVIIAVACGHRAESFDACRRLIDSLKQDVPIWKKNVYQDGFIRWVG